MRTIQDNILFYHDTMHDLLLALNQGIYGVVFVVDDDGRMIGMFTDGDVRRALLKGASMTEPIEAHMNRRFVAGKVDNTRAQNVKLLSEKIRHIPVLDEQGKPVDLISWAEMWRLPVMQPALGGNELAYVSDCITTNWISSQGEYVQRFQDMFSAYLGGVLSLCTSSGTTALHLALEALGLGEGDEVIVPDLTFGASANAVIHCGATPVFCDIDPETWTMDPVSVEAAITPRTRALMPVHLYGHPCDMDPIMDLARQYGLFVIEDCAEALGATFRGRPVGTIGDIGCFSFFANKVITTGEGGMVTTTDPALYERMMLLRDHGMQKKKRYWHLEAGFNYRMTNVQAAIGVAQMERIDQFLKNRRKIVARYQEHLNHVPGIVLPPEAPWAHNIYWLYAILVDEEQTGISRDFMIEWLLSQGIETRPFFYPLHNQPAYKASGHSRFPVTERVAACGINLPTSNDIVLEDVDRVCHAIMTLLSDEKRIQSALAGWSGQHQAVT